MQLRTFLAKDMKAALARCAPRWGRRRSSSPANAPRAAASWCAPRSTRHRPAPPEEAEPSAAELAPAEATADFEQSYHDGLIRRLRGEPAPDAGEDLQPAELLALLRSHRTPETLAHIGGSGGKKRAHRHDTGARLGARPTHADGAARPGVSQALLLVGPPGAGKTAVAAKIAAHASSPDAPCDSLPPTRPARRRRTARNLRQACGRGMGRARLRRSDR